MIWLLTRVVVWPVKLLFGTTKVATRATTTVAAEGAKAGYKAGRFALSGRFLLIGAGVGAGLLLAKRPGAETREMLRKRLVDQGLIKDGGSGGASMPTAEPYSPRVATGPAVPTTGASNGAGPADLTPEVPDIADTTEAVEAIESIELAGGTDLSDVGTATSDLSVAGAEHPIDALPDEPKTGGPS